MGRTTKCSYCGKKSKIIYICPECGETYCYEHKSKESHNCGKKELNKENVNNKIELNTQDISRALVTQDQEYSISIPEFIFHDKENSEQKKIEITSDTIDNEEIYETRGSETYFVEQDQKEVTLEKEIQFIKTGDNSKITLEDEIKVKSSEGKNIVRNISMKKILFVGLFIIILSISYVYISGSFSNTPPISTQQKIYNNDNYKNDSLIRSEYNELNDKYKKIELDYYELENEYKELKILYNSSKEYNTEQILANMIQITIPPDSNTIFYYEIPVSGYITVEYYSDIEIYAMVGSTKLENVYYSRQPQYSKSSEYVFSVPVLPELNLMFVNPDRQQQATLFFKVVYHCT